MWRRFSVIWQYARLNRFRRKNQETSALFFCHEILRGELDSLGGLLQEKRPRMIPAVVSRLAGEMGRKTAIGAAVALRDG